MVKQLLFRLAKSKWMGKAAGLAFRWCPWAIPVKKLYRSKTVLAMEHPRPAYPNHVILSPRAPIPDLLSLGRDPSPVYREALWESLVQVISEQSAYRDGFTLVANGGTRQEVGQVHFHLFTGHEWFSGTKPELGQAVKQREECIAAYLHPAPEWDIHLLLLSDARSSGSREAPAAGKVFSAALQMLPKLVESYPLVENGYSMLYQYRPGDHLQRPVFHIISGKKTGTSNSTLSQP